MSGVRRRCALLLSLCALLLGGCSMLDRSYSQVTEHQQFSDESESDSILRAENYQGLVSAVLYLVQSGQEAGMIHLYQYTSITGTAAGDIDRAFLEVTQDDPLGAYAVDYIKYDVEQTAAYYEIDVKLAYTRTQEQIRSIVSVTGSSAIELELRELLPEQPEECVFRISYFTDSDSAESIRETAMEVYREFDGLSALKDISVALYPDSGRQRVAEIRFIPDTDSPESAETE